MKVYLFSDYLEAINGEPLSEDKAICEIDAIEKMPNGIVKVKGKLARVCCFFREKDHIYIEYMAKLPKKNEVFRSAEITCPHCGNENSDSWEASESEDEHYCDVCSSVFSYERCVEVSYSSKIVERNDQVLVLG